MKKLLLFAACISSFTMMATTHNVEVGGGGANGTPYYDPQDLNIVVGDIVNWTWVSGQHNVTSTDGPMSFMSGNLNSPNEWSFTFNTAGVYSYECTLFNHSDTQFGTITVGANNVNENAVATPNFDVYPNPANAQVNIEKNGTFVSDIRIFDITGKLVFVDQSNSQVRTRISIAHMTKGIYFVELNLNGRATRRRLVIE
jgi:plastocyanin